MRTVYKYTKIFSELWCAEVPAELYPDKELTAAWLNINNGTMMRASELHWRTPYWNLPTNTTGPR